MSWIRTFFGVDPSAKYASQKVVQPAYEDVERRLEETRAPVIRTSFAQKAEAPSGSRLLTSRLGGAPWMPDGAQWPRDRVGRPLTFLMQINFAEMPALAPLPEAGLLQIFIGANEIYGADFDDGRMGDFKVCFHQNPQGGALMPAPAWAGEILSPLYDETAKNGAGLLFKKSSMVMLPADWRFHGRVFEDSPAVEDEDWVENLFDRIDDQNNATTVYLGGYSDFTQSDPRQHIEWLRDYDFSLATIDSDDAIMWGDSGIAQFFARSSDIAAGDFSNIVFHWDCC